MENITGIVQGDMLVWMGRNVSENDNFTVKNFIFGFVPLKVPMLVHDGGYNGVTFRRPLAGIEASGFATVYEARLLIPKSDWAKERTFGHAAEVKLIGPLFRRDRYYKSEGPAEKLWSDLVSLFMGAMVGEDIANAISKIVKKRMKGRF